ncbi:DNA primase family protein [Kocuria carniphila]|uniref:DNA primase family protein n=1 Tax=Kocuria carniphila TaxID=262208 RepID=UPI0034DB38D8
MTTPDPLAQAREILDVAGVQEPEPEHEAADPWSESALSETVSAEILDGRYLYTAEGGWMVWTGVVWERTPTETVTEAVRRHLRDMAVEAARSGSPYDMRQAARRQSAATVRAVTDLARGQVLARLQDFDQDLKILVTPAGVVHLPTGRMAPHDPSRLVTKCTGVSYVPGATHPDWDAALEAVPADIREWVQVRMGQAITGHTPDDDVVPILQGGGSNGKSTILGAIARALGDYATTVPDSLLVGAESHPTDAMTLRGTRLAVMEELPEGRYLNTQTLKKIVGTPEITGRYMRCDFVTFSATHSLMVSTNFRPEVAEVDGGTWRRLALVAFPYRYRTPGDPLTGPMDRHGDPGLRDRLQNDSAAQEAVLAWLVEGAQRWYAAGRQMPPKPQRVLDDTAAWRGEQDAVLGYASERLVPDPAGVIWTTDLREDLSDWLTERGQRPWSDRTISQRLGQHQWATEHAVARTKARHHREGVSRPTGYDQTPLPTGPYWAWTGVRFRTSTDPD